MSTPLGNGYYYRGLCVTSNVRTPTLITSKPTFSTARIRICDKAVVELLAGGYVERSFEPPTVCSPLSVVVSGAGKKRLVVNLQHVNENCIHMHSCYGDTHTQACMLACLYAVYMQFCSYLSIMKSKSNHVSCLYLSIIKSKSNHVSML